MTPKAPSGQERRKHGRAPSTPRYRRLRKELETPFARFLSLRFIELCVLVRLAKGRGRLLLARFKPKASTT